MSERRKAGRPAVARVTDSVDAILDEWAVQRPDLDFTPVGVVTRLARLRALFDSALLEVFERHGLSAADFQVVVTLRRAGPPHRLPQARLMTQLSLTSGTVSVRLERLQKAGIVTREPDPGDRRGTLVALSPHGLDLFDRVAPDHLANEDRLLSALDDTERETLVELLRRLLVSLEDRPDSAGATAAGSALGLTLESAPRARRRRAAVGLSETPGLLVADVVDPAQAAGVRRGDLLVAYDGRPLRSEVTLAEALRGRSRAKVTVDVLRGEERLSFRSRP